ncbi:MAG: transporter substrate-binding domain-containing protein [Rhodospirillaceae bacterium]
MAAFSAHGSSAFAGDGAVKLTSLEWPPFSGAQLPGLGASVGVSRAAFGAVGLGLEVEFYPWQRAVKTGLEVSGYVGYFPEYFSDSLTSQCAFSEPAGESPLGFVERKNAPFAWATLADLGAVTVGTVSGYANTDEFDKLVADGKIRAEAVVDDLTNLRKVASDRVRLAVIDRNVFEYLLASEPSLADVRGELQFNAHPLEVKKLYICFRKDAAGLAAKQKFDEGLGKIKVQDIMNDGLRQAGRPTH